MKINNLFGIIFVIVNLVSCQSKIDNIALTDFTKELISMYINDVENLDAKNRKDEIIVVSITDSLHYSLSVWANDSKSYKLCREDFIGQTSYCGHLVRVFGDENSNFYSLMSKVKRKRRCRDNFTEYDPLVWKVCFYRELSFCKMATYKVAPDRDISAIQNLAEKYFGTSKVPIVNDKIYHPTEAEIAPQFALGEECLRQIISLNVAVKRDSVPGKVPVVVNVLIDKSGKATLNNISRSSNDTEIDNEALRVAKIICQYEFVPALHRGEKVNSLFPIIFLRSDYQPSHLER